MNIVLEIQNITIAYRNKSIIKNSSLTLNEGSLTALLGRNGSGKSTLLNSIAGFLKPSNGNIFICNTNIYKCTAGTKSKLISYLDSSQLYLQNIIVKELVAFGRYPYTNLFAAFSENDKLITNSSMELCGINNLAERYFNELSDGEKQKVLIARAITQNTPVILMDEPTSHLDFIARKETIKLLKKLCTEKNKTIIFSSHEPELCMEFANNILITSNNAVKEANKNEALEILINS
jgi:iron complex transport system ATP-binding protein